MQALDIKHRPADWWTVIAAGAVVIIDEVWRFWPAGLKAMDVPESDRAFLAEHRHHVGSDGRTTEIVLVCQELGQVAAFARQLIEQTYICTKLLAIGADKRFRMDIYQGAVSGRQLKRAARLRELFGTYRPEVYAWYQSHTAAPVGVVGQEQRMDRRGNVLRRPMVWLGIPGALVTVPVAVWGTFSLLGQLGGAEASGPSTAETVTVAAPAVQQGSSPARLPVSREWRIAGVIIEQRGRYQIGRAMLARAGGGVHYVRLGEDCHKGDSYEWECELVTQARTRYRGSGPG